MLQFKQCENCGKRMPVSSAFCPTCGAQGGIRVQQPVPTGVPPSVPQVPPPQSPHLGQPFYGQGSGAQRPKQNAANFLWLLLLIPCLWFMCGRGETSSAPTATDFQQRAVYAVWVHSKEAFGDDINFDLIGIPATDLGNGRYQVDGEFTTKYDHVVHFHAVVQEEPDPDPAKFAWRIEDYETY